MPTIFRLARETSSADASTVTETNAPSILAINGFFCGVAVVVVLARIYVRSIMLKTFGTDDYLITGAMVRYSFSAQKTIHAITGSCKFWRDLVSLPKRSIEPRQQNFLSLWKTQYRFQVTRRDFS
jgi:hypothetical protein